MGIRMFRCLCARAAARIESSAVAQGAVQERNLANGLRVIAKEDPRTAHIVWYVPGSGEK